MKPLLTAEWTQLLVATFEADKKLLQKYIPYKTELNDWNGKNYMSMVGFMFGNPVIAGIPSPVFRKFEEINLRFYVRHKCKTGWKKAVVFIKEIAPSNLIGLAAKWLYHENFICLPTRHSISNNGTEQKTEYQWKIDDDWDHLKLTTPSSPVPPVADSLEAFIHDHYYAFTRQSETKTREFVIEHRPWNIYPSLTFDMKLNATRIYGGEFAEYFQQPPASSFLMDGSRTKVSFPMLI